MTSSTGRQLVVALIAVWFVSVSFPVQAGGVYWADYRHNGEEWIESLRASNLDGTNSQVMFWGDVQGIAVDPVGQQIYYTIIQGWPPTLRRANIDGSGQRILHSFQHFDLRHLALDREDGWVYFSATGGKTCDGIFRKRMNGSGPLEPIHEWVCAAGVAIDEEARKLYWMGVGGPNSIKRSNLDGSEIETVLTNLGSTTALALDAARGKIYWSKSNGPEIVLRANLDGTDVETVVPGDRYCRGIALDPLVEKVYWAITSSADKGIYRANLDGSDVEKILDVDARDQIAVDPTPGDVVVPALSVVGALLLALTLLAIATFVIRR